MLSADPSTASQRTEIMYVHTRSLQWYLALSASTTKHCLDRSQHFQDIGITNFRFFDALGPKNANVIDAFKQGHVKALPGCFRCGRATCGCRNNILIPQQVANCLSYCELFKSISGQAYDFTLICEDDAVFHVKRMDDVMRKLIARRRPEEKTIYRLAGAAEPQGRLQEPDEMEFSQQVVMSNPAFVLNGPMARYLVDAYGAIETTSDIRIHRQLSTSGSVHAETVTPSLVTELSYYPETARFHSRIHPKGIDELDEERKSRHIMRASSAEEYRALLEKWTDAS